jgi:pimeloyl-ACP methyl ester carboxylesterase
MLALGLATLSASARAVAAPASFSPCRPAQMVIPVHGLQCTTVDVPLDRAAPTVGHVRLAVQRLAASGPRLGTIVLLAGGPGQAALGPFEEFLVPLAKMPALHGYELVSFDQRGTGQSEEISCPFTRASLADGLASLTAACGKALGAARGYYTSEESVQDLEAVRQALGGAPLSLLAVSYGGHVAGIYAREHPEGVARMVLDSPSTLNGDDALSSQRERALRRVLDEGICGAGDCRSFTSDPYGDLTRLTSSLRGHPRRTRIVNSAGTRETVSLSEEGVLRLLSDIDVEPRVRLETPAAITAAADGDSAPLARLAQESAEAGIEGELARFAGAIGTPSARDIGDETGQPLSLAVLFATYCEETRLPWPTTSDPAERAGLARSFFATTPSEVTAPFAPRTAARESGITLCMHWPATPPPPPPPSSVSAVPTLILSGEDDLRVSYERALEVAAGYSDAQLLRIPDTGHSTVTADPTNCAREAMISFLTTAQAPSACAPVDEPQAIALPPVSLAAATPVGSSSRLAGEGAAAVVATLEDLRAQPIEEGGGLHGGSWERNGLSLKLQDVVDVPGVSVSGSLGLVGSGISGRLRIRGGVRGRLEVHGHTLEGHLDGAAVRTTLALL